MMIQFVHALLICFINISLRAMLNMEKQIQLYTRRKKYVDQTRTELYRRKIENRIFRHRVYVNIDKLLGITFYDAPSHMI